MSWVAGGQKKSNTVCKKRAVKTMGHNMISLRDFGDKTRYGQPLNPLGSPWRGFKVDISGE